MSYEGTLTDNYQSIRQRLWGKPEEKPKREIPPPDVIHIIDVDTLTAKEAEIRLPGPKNFTQRDLDELVENEEDWQVAVTAILKGNGENMRRLTSQHRDTHIVKVRRDVAHYLHQARGWSTPRIGRFMNRDHSSIVHMLRPWARKEKYQQARELADRVWAKYEAQNPLADGNN
jgi:hypothetical protein